MSHKGNFTGIATVGAAMVATAALARMPAAAIGQERAGSWFALLDRGDFSKWREPVGDWVIAGEVFLDPSDPARLAWKPGKGAVVNGKKGRTKHLFTKLEHGDVEAHIEFMVPKGSNSGVYFMGRYEIQVFDSWGVVKPKYGDCGGIYERWINGKGFEGRPPRVNASKRPGEWQTFDVVFRAPRFDASGKKIANAKFVKVVHNGKVIHENEDVTGPTRAAAFNDEKPLGPLMLQGDHGPVAYRNIRIRDAYTRLAGYRFGDSRADLVAIQEDVRSASPEQFRAIEARLIEVLNSPGATFAGKQFACRMLSRRGTAQSVPALAPLLLDAKLSHMARYALERMPAPEAGAGLREALGKIRGKLRVGVINSIAARGDRRAVPQLRELLNEKDLEVVRAALAALGRIGGPAATGILAEAKVPDACKIVWADAYLACADNIMAEGKKADAVAIYRKMLREKISPATRIAAIQGLVRAKDKSALPEIKEAIDSENAAVRTAAKQALEALTGSPER